MQRQNESRATNERLAAQLALQEKVERKTQELERLLSSAESERRIAEQHHAKREAELVTQITELTTEKDALEVFVHKEKGEVTRMQRALEDAQAELRSKTSFHEKLTRLHNEQVQVSTGLSEEILSLKRTHSEAVRNHGVEVDQLQLKLRSFQATANESAHALQERCQSLEDSLISTSQELKRTSQQLEETRAQLTDAKASAVELTKAAEMSRAEAQEVSEELTAQVQECGTLTQRLTEATTTVATLRETIAELSEQVAHLDAADTTRTKELATVKADLRETEDQLQETLRKLEATENDVHYLQSITIPDINSSAMDAVERSKSDQVRVLLTGLVRVALQCDACTRTTAPYCVRCIVFNTVWPLVG
jgi:chromosome segregation ATPase